MPKEEPKPLSALLELSQKLTRLRKQKSKQDEALTATKAEIGEVETAMIAMMTEADLPSFKHGGNNFSMAIETYPSPEPEQKDALYDLLRKRGLEHLFTINHNTLKSTLRGFIEANDGTLPDWLGGLVKTFEKTTIKVSKG